VSTGAGYAFNPYNGTAETGWCRRARQCVSIWNRPNWAGRAPNSGPPTTVLGEFHLGEYINACICKRRRASRSSANANIGLFTPPGGGTPGPATKHPRQPGQRDPDRLADGAMPDFINRTAGSTRALAHGQSIPGLETSSTLCSATTCSGRSRNVQPDSWKGYNVAFAASSAPGLPFARWRLDDEAIAYPIYQIITRNRHQLKTHPGFFNICIHKGLSANGTQPGVPITRPISAIRTTCEGGLGLAAPELHHLPLVHPAGLLGAPVAAGHRESVRCDGPGHADRQRRAYRSEHPVVHSVGQIAAGKYVRERNRRRHRPRAPGGCATSTPSSAPRWPR